MTFRLSSALLIAACPVVMAGWLEDVRTLRAGPFPPPPTDLSARYVFGWSGIEAAEADVRLTRAANGVWSAQVTGGTKGAARSLWKLDAEYTAEVTETDWRSRSSRLVERYKRYEIEVQCDFRPGGVRSLRQSKKPGAAKSDWMNFYVPGLRDMAAALLLARSQPLEKGDAISLAVFPGEWMYLVRVKVEGREKIRWQKQQRDVLRASLEIDWIDKDYALKPHKKFHRGTVWVSDDETRLPLRVEVKVFIGHVFAELVELQSGM